MASASWLSESQIEATVRLEPALVLLTLALATWGAYKILLKGVSHERHKIFADNFKNLAMHFSITVALFGSYKLLEWMNETPESLGSSYLAHFASRVVVYVGFLTVIWGAMVFIKNLRIIAYEYLFFTSMKAGVPLLLLNIFTLALSLVAAGWILTSFCNVDLTPLLATSAILSIVLGLALQDTLGNLFAAVAIQIDKPFELGDWIEVRHDSNKIAGQVQEISWRATVLLAVTEELITIPNRNMAQAQISNYSGRERPFIRSHVFRIPHDSSIKTTKEVLLTTAYAIPGISHTPAPLVFVSETTESWITLKAIYFIEDYGIQYSIADRFLSEAIDALRECGIMIATPRLSVDVVGDSKATDDDRQSRQAV
jgi:small-conductance mechanosensitive channel